MTPWLSIVCPTIGRDSLRHTVESVTAQADHVELLVVADTHGSTHTEQLERMRPVVEGLGAHWLEHDGGLHMVGQPQRTFGARQAQAPYVWFTQDDNISPAGGLALIREAIEQQSHPRPLFFRFLAAWRQTIWREPFLKMGNIDADCLVFPRDIAQRVEWGLRYEGDFDAAERAFSLVSGDVAWCDAVISIARPNSGHLWWR